MGGVPLLTVIGTPRSIGESLGERMKARVQVLGQHLCEQYLGVGPTEQPLEPEQMRMSIASCRPFLSPHEPSMLMELESMAATAQVDLVDLLAVHGHSDLLGYFGCRASGSPTSFIALPASQTEDGRSLMAFVVELDPAFIPYLALVHRIPAHGPASLQLTVAGIAPLAGISEAGIAVAANRLRITDGVAGLFTAHILGSLLCVPTMDDAVSRAQSGPRFGGASFHMLTAGGRRCSIEVSGRRQAILPDVLPSAPRAHTDHALDPAIAAVAGPNPDGDSRARLARIAAQALGATRARSGDIAGWFGFASGRTGRVGTGEIPRSPLAGTAEAAVILVLDPEARTLHICRGGASFDRLTL